MIIVININILAIPSEKIPKNTVQFFLDVYIRYEKTNMEPYLVSMPCSFLFQCFCYKYFHSSGKKVSVVFSDVLEVDYRK